MKTNLLILAIIFTGILSAQTTADFENFNLSVDSSLNGSDLQGGFTSGNIFLSNTYETQFGSWFGNAISTMTDVTTAGFTNDLSVISGSGNNNSLGYGVAFMSYLTNNSIVQLTGIAAGGASEGVYVNNSTYAYLSMRDGDAIAKKFGGATGNDPDYFLLTIQKYLGGNLSSEKIEFYLADFRFTDNTQDYIIDEWTYIDLSPLGNADSLAFSLSSTDNGQFGMNTPAYFCFDDFTTKDEVVLSVQSIETLGFQAFPNPVKDVLMVKNGNSSNANIQLCNALGQSMLYANMVEDELQINLANLPLGVYYLNISLENGTQVSKAILKN